MTIEKYMVVDRKREEEWSPGKGSTEAESKVEDYKRAMLRAFDYILEPVTEREDAIKTEVHSDPFAVECPAAAMMGV